MTDIVLGAGIIMLNLILFIISRRQDRLADYVYALSRRVADLEIALLQRKDPAGNEPL